MKIQFFGATQEVTGSMFLLSAGGKNILIDCGFHQGGNFVETKNYDPFPFDPAHIDLVTITHAHLDHVGRLPKLVKDGYRGPILATAATADLTRLVLNDAQHLMQEEVEDGREPLYSQEDVNRTMARFQAVDYGVPATHNGVTIRFYDAGHILGSATIEISDGGQTVVFSGDLGNAGTPLLKPTQIPPAADAVVLESTYGGRTHEPVTERTQKLRLAITDTVKRKGVLMIPSFAIERTQELLYEIDQLRKEGKIPQLPVFLDSPLAINATAVFERHSELWNRQSQAMKEAGDNFFRFPGLVRTLTVEDSKKINDVPSPKVILAGAGMMEGGRILHHLRRYLPDQRSTLLVVGFQAKGTLGRQLLDGASRVRIYGEWVNVAAQVRPIGAYSAHADGPALVKWLQAFHRKPQQIFLVHGEPEEMTVLTKSISNKLSVTPQMPRVGETIEVSATMAVKAQYVA